MMILHIPSWFPTEEKPLDGNFILKHVATTLPFARAIIVHHQVKGASSMVLPEGVTFYPIYVEKGWSRLRLMRAYLSAYKQIEATYGKPDLIHAHVALPLGIVAAALSRRYHIPLLLTEHWSIYRPETRRALTLSQRLQMRFVYSSVTYLTTVTRHLREMIVETLPLVEKIPYSVVSNVVDTDSFCYQPSPVHEKKRILHISTLDNRVKNIMGILRAVAQLSQRRRDFRLEIIHELTNVEVETFIRAHQLQDIVVLLGKRTEVEVATCIQQSDFMLMFSNYETQSCVLLESFCCGRPALTTAVGGIPEIAHAGNARFVEAGNEPQLVEQLDIMLDSYQDYDGKRISDEARERYSVRTIGEAWRSIYQKLINH